MSLSPEGLTEVETRASRGEEVKGTAHMYMRKNVQVWAEGKAYSLSCLGGVNAY